eukprot:339304-Pleurochrysis_carterae.AAC.1
MCGHLNSKIATRRRAPELLARISLLFNRMGRTVRRADERVRPWPLRSIRSAVWLEAVKSERDVCARFAAAGRLDRAASAGGAQPRGYTAAARIARATRGSAAQHERHCRRAIARLRQSGRRLGGWGSIARSTGRLLQDDSA